MSDKAIEELKELVQTQGEMIRELLERTTAGREKQKSGSHEREPLLMTRLFY